MRIFEIAGVTDFVDRATDIARTGGKDRVIELAGEIKQAGSAVVRRVKELLATPQPAAAAPAQPAATTTTAAQNTTQPAPKP